GRERRRVGVARDGVGDVPVERPPFVVEAPELALVACERAVRAARAPPRKIDVDLAEDDEMIGEARPRFGARHRSAAEREYRDVGGGERNADGVLLDPAELRLAPFGEELWN